MNAPLDLRMDKKTFLRWAQSQEGRYELIGGRVVVQQSPSRRHGYIARNIDDSLRQRLDGKKWSVLRGDISVEYGEETRVPDVLVEPAGLPEDLNVTDQPVLLAEVLSPSSMQTDFNAKPNLYFQIPSLEIYIVASQDRPYLWVWQRSPDAARAFPELAVEFDTLTAIVDLAHFGITLPLAEIYRGIAFA
jgi:Uma2 family endonuclease